MEGLRKKLLGDELKRQSQGIPSDYDPSMPWDEVFNMACEDDTWWQEQVEEPCLRVKRKASQAAQRCQIARLKHADSFLRIRSNGRKNKHMLAYDQIVFLQDENAGTQALKRRLCRA